MTRRPCRLCGDPLDADAPPAVTTCSEWAAWRAAVAGDVLPAEEADALTLYGGLCRLGAALATGRDLV